MRVSNLNIRIRKNKNIRIKEGKEIAFYKTFSWATLLNL